MAVQRMQKQSFRRATSADASTVREITRAAYSKWIPVIGREPKPMTANYVQTVADHVASENVGLIESFIDWKFPLPRLPPTGPPPFAASRGGAFFVFPSMERGSVD
jgi:hypothetical protein